AGAGSRRRSARARRAPQGRPPADGGRRPGRRGARTRGRAGGGRRRRARGDRRAAPRRRGHLVGRGSRPPGRLRRCRAGTP
ncbi:MAG: hypothetical protein AVDCRST_MAG65-1207, partial [uncultured Solirubrobacteraceae bacterium]